MAELALPECENISSLIDECENTESNSATLTCFLESKDGQKLALTCEHVILNTDQNVYTKKPFLKENRLGTCNISSNEIKLDVGLITLDENKKNFCRNELYDAKGCRRSWKIFNGDYKSLGDKYVFKCIPQDKKTSSNTIWNTSIWGRVASSAIHEQHKDVLGNQCFLVASEGSTSFAVEGESGTLLAADFGESDVYLVGAISGRLSNDHSQKYFICVLLSCALSFFNYKESNRFSVCTEDIDSFSVKTNAIVCGSTILFKRIENFGKVDFEIEEQVLRLFNINFEKDDLSTVELIFEAERQFRRKVFARQQIKDMAIYDPDRPEQVSLIYFYLTVQSLYAQKTDQAKKFLKEGIRCLSKVRQSQLKLLCKCVTYVTWYFIDTDEQKKLKLVLKEGLAFFKNNEHLSHFPKECIGYHYYDFSRYYVAKGRRKKAISMAEKGHDCLKVLKDANQSTECYKDIFNRFIFTVCQYAESLLWCGDNFEYADKDIPESDVTSAATLIQSIEEGIDEAPAVQITQYRLAKCDIFYRKQDYKNALEQAKLCQEIAKSNDLQEEECSAGKRCVYLTRKMRIRQNYSSLKKGSKFVSRVTAENLIKTIPSHS